MVKRMEAERSGRSGDKSDNSTDSTVPDSPFDSNGRQFAWDSISYGWLVECRRKYYLAMLQAWQSKQQNVHLRFGIIFQAADEVYEKSRAEGATYQEALRKAVHYALIESYDWPYTHKSKTREALIRTIIWYREDYKDDPFKTVQLSNGKPAVELSFRIDMDSNRVLCGHLDKLGVFGSDNFFKDVKTTGSIISSYFFEKFDLDNQMDIYSLASRVIYKTPVTGGMIDGVQIAQDFSRSQRGFIYRTKDQLNEFIQEFHHYTGEYLDLAERAKWPMNKKACLNGRSDDPTKEATGCVFRGICGRSPSVREEFMKSNFEKRQWNPLDVR